MNDPSVQVASVLEARLAELEKTASRKRGLSPWDFAFSIVPWWLAVLAVGSFIAFNVWDYHNAAQQAAAKTKLRIAEAALKEAEAIAENTKMDGETLRHQITRAELEKAQADAVRTQTEADALTTAASKDGDTLLLEKLRAELDRAQAEAQRTRTEADALNTKVGDASLRLQTLRAELDIKRTQAAKSALDARAARERSGMLTLEQRAARAKLMITEMEAAESRMKAGTAAALSPQVGRSFDLSFYQNHRNDFSIAGLRGWCIDNQFAELIDCPPQLITRHPPQISPRVIDDSAPPKPVATPAAQPSIIRFATVSAPEFLNLRRCPKPDNHECPGIRIPTGARVKVLADADNGWKQIEVAKQGGGSLKGYVNSTLLKFE